MSRNKEDFVDFEIWIICKYQKGKNGIKYYVYVTYKVTTSLNHIHQCYRQRFGIETSYRLKNLYLQHNYNLSFELQNLAIACFVIY